MNCMDDLKMVLRLVGILLICCHEASCVAVKPYEKEFLLDPVMDDDFQSRLTSPLVYGVLAQHEKLGVIGSASTGGTACPTCGG